MPRMGVSPDGMETTGRKLFRRVMGTRRQLRSARGGAIPSWASARALVFTRWLQVLVCAVVIHPGSGDLHAIMMTDELQESLRRLKRLSLDELLDEQVVTVAKSPEPMSRAMAAVQVITSEDIRRSAAATLPEALRLASNLQVARAGSSSWAISARGFNNTLANKLLVMIDGRAVYTPLFAGVFWDAQHVMLEDIERIEVVSGPGGTLWGANAVNGVINVITKSAKDTQGTYLSGAAGSFMQDFGAVRYGGGNGSNLFFRVYAQRYDYFSSRLSDGSGASDAWDMTQGGFRFDWDPSPSDTLTLQGDLYVGNVGGADVDTSLDGQNLLGRWTRAFSSESELQVQMYLDRTWREAASYKEDLITYDLDIQHRLQLSESQRLIWGGGYRVMRDRIHNTGAGLAFLPPDRNLQLVSAFIQDDITLVPDRWRISLGAKFEHNDYSGFEFQPSARVAWTPHRNHTLWSAVSRAVRSPSRVDTELFIPAPPVAPGTPNLAGGPGFVSEDLLSLELGYRVRPFRPLWMSVTAYYNFYDDLRSLDEITTNNFILANHFKGEIRGVEVSAEYTPAAWWRIRAGYNFLHKSLWAHGGNDPTAGVREGNDPEHQFTFHSIVDLPAHFELDVTGRYVDSLPSPRVPEYVTLDARLAWRYHDLEISLVGQNLVEPRHREFGTREIPRSIYGMITLRF
jgi:iron complex outermembrane recepter protein